MAGASINGQVVDWQKLGRTALPTQHTLKRRWDREKARGELGQSWDDVRAEKAERTLALRHLADRLSLLYHNPSPSVPLHVYIADPKTAARARVVHHNLFGAMMTDSRYKAPVYVGTDAVLEALRGLEERYPQWASHFKAIAARAQQISYPKRANAKLIQHPQCKKGWNAFQHRDQHASSQRDRNGVLAQSLGL